MPTTGPNTHEAKPPSAATPALPVLTSGAQTWKPSRPLRTEGRASAQRSSTSSGTDSRKTQENPRSMPVSAFLRNNYPSHPALSAACRRPKTALKTRAARDPTTCTDSSSRRVAVGDRPVLGCINTRWSPSSSIPTRRLGGTRIRRAMSPRIPRPPTRPLTR